MSVAGIVEAGVLHHGPRRLEARTRVLQRCELVADGSEALIVRVLPMRRRALALQDDFLHRAPGGREIGDLEEAGQAEFAGAHLSLAVADEHILLADVVDQLRKPAEHAVIKLTLTFIILRRGREQLGT